MLAMLRSMAWVLSLPLLVSCTAGPAVPAGSGKGDAVVHRESTWRILSKDESRPGNPAEPRPEGFLEARRLELSDGPSGTVYVIYDLSDRPLGHVTQKGHAVRYGAGVLGTDLDLGSALILDQAAAILGLDPGLHLYGVRGGPAELP